MLQIRCVSPTKGGLFSVPQSSTTTTKLVVALLAKLHLTVTTWVFLFTQDALRSQPVYKNKDKDGGGSDRGAAEGRNWG